MAASVVQGSISAFQVRDQALELKSSGSERPGGGALTCFVSGL